MKEKISPVIQVLDLFNLIKSDDLVIIDACNGENQKLTYQQKHLDGALFVDLNTQLSDIGEDSSNGGRHPLPKIKQFSHTLTNLGISPKSHVVVYDNNNGANAAARFWWMMKSVGHQKIQVLNGGLQEAEKMKFPLSSKKEVVKKTKPYKVDNWKLPLALITEVENFSKDENYIVIDVRESLRYQGKTEPIDLVAGHIPGAINIPFKENLDKNGLFLAPNKLKKNYRKVFGNLKSDNIIFYCGSGVSACHSLLAITYAGLEITKLYVGSWSEWSRNNKEIETVI